LKSALKGIFHIGSTATSQAPWTQN